MSKRRSTRLKSKINYGVSHENKTKDWSSSELLALAGAVQKFGSGDYDSLASAVETKTVADIKLFIQNSSKKARKKVTIKSENQESCSSKLSDLQSKPNIFKWKKMAFSQMDSVIRTRDYSRNCMKELVQAFLENEKESSSFQVVNVKAIYKYILDCLNGEIPALLPPLESAIVIKLFEDLKDVCLSYGCEEECKWLLDYSKQVVYIPKIIKEEPEENDTNKQSVFVPKAIKVESEKKGEENKMNELSKEQKVIEVNENALLILNKHKQLIKSFNPLLVPIELLSKEQNFLSKEFNVI